MAKRIAKRNVPHSVMNKPVLKDLFMVVDIDRSAVSDELYNHLVSQHMTYQDMVLKEHILNIDDAITKPPRRLRKEITVLYKIAKEQLSSYVRFVN
jgi:hypothetical protein